jgi:predicted NBD/HSP70 family sugar kinase
MYLIGDIGGTKSRFSTTKDCKTFDEPKVVSTPQDYEEFKSLISEFVETGGSGGFEGACLGISGTTSENKDYLEHSPHLKGWENKPIKQDLIRIFGTENINLENDTALVGLGESIHGAGKEYEIVAYVTISTGIGGVKIESGKIDSKKYSFEPGHQIIDMHDGYSSLEVLASGSGIKESTGKDPRDIDDATFWDEITRTLAVGLHNTILHWSPEVLVVGGGIVNSGKISTDNLSKYIQELLIVFPKIPDIKPAELGDFGGLYGAMEYLEQLKVKN